ncbi:MAG: hypothetical protein JXR97_05270, partial [Planctomycetes bacterium]|nr:hypothetical protein [Planctomycetota bacterium]
MTDKAVKLLADIKEAETSQRHEVERAKVEAAGKIEKARPYASELEKRAEDRSMAEAQSMRGIINKECEERLKKLENSYREARNDMRKAAA